MEEKDKNKIKEQETAYSASRKITIFNSFEEMENDQLAYYATLTTEVLFKNLKLITLAAFGIKDESQLPQPDRKIKFE